MKEWWQEFFIPITGELMFKPRAAQTQKEVEQILKQIPVKKGSKVLDLACGIGRHSFVFAKRGMDVTGLDFSNSYLSAARKEAKRTKANVEFLHGDMRNLKPYFREESFDLVVSLFNSFGYFNRRKDDLRMLDEVYRTLKPGGAFVINTLNGVGVVKALEKPVSYGREPIENVFIIDSAHFDKKRRRTMAVWTIVDARKSKAQIYRMKLQQNVYTHRELKQLLKEAGFKIEKTWGLLAGSEFVGNKSWHQTIVARKA